MIKEYEIDEIVYIKIRIKNISETEVEIFKIFRKLGTFF